MPAASHTYLFIRNTDMNLTREATGYKQDLNFARDSSDTLWVSWIAFEGRVNTINWTETRAGRSGQVCELECAYGTPASPRMVLSDPHQLIWVEWSDRRGRLLAATLGADESEATAAILSNEYNCHDFSCAWNAGGQAWLAAEVWDRGKASICLLELVAGKWQFRGQVPASSGFAIRPCVTAGHDSTFLLSWDDYGPGGYRIGSAFLPVAGAAEIIYLDNEQTWETLSANAQAEDGTWYLSRTSEELVKLDNGALNHHSAVKVARYDKGRRQWQEIDAIDIDYAMNPWQAAYVGRRRCSHLAAQKGGGMWAFIEAKQDPKKMDPNLGRLLCRRYDGAEARQELHCVLDGHCNFVFENPPAPQDSIYVATKTQAHKGDLRIDYFLHSVELGSIAERVRPPAISYTSFEPEPEPQTADSPSTGELKLFFGDPHVHSRISADLDGEPDELYHFARDVAQLDFMALTDNDFTWFTEPLRADVWERLQSMANFFYEPGVFTTFVAWEYTRHRQVRTLAGIDSHRCVLFPAERGIYYTWYGDNLMRPAELLKKLKNETVLLHDHAFYGFDITDDSKECNMELCSGWRNWMVQEDYQQKLHGLLDRGVKVGFVGGGDVHERVPGLNGGLAGIWAESNTRESLFHALQNRRVFATSGLRPYLSFRIFDAFMGGTTHTPDRPVLEFEVRCRSKIETIEVVRNGTVVHTTHPDRYESRLEWEDYQRLNGPAYYYVHVQFEGEEPQLYFNMSVPYGKHAWSSPIWVLPHSP